MKKTLLITIVVMLFHKAFGQSNALSNINIDSVHLHYFAWCYGVDAKILFTKDSVSFFLLVRPTDRINNYDLIYSTNNRKTITEYYYLLKTIMDIEPKYVVDTNTHIIDDCRQSIEFDFYYKDSIVKKVYLFYADALFPFAFTRLYYMIMPIIYRDKERSDK